MTLWARSGSLAAQSLFQKMVVIGVALAPAGRGSGRTAIPRSSASVGKGSVRIAASTAPDSSAGTMSGKDMILICTSRRVSPSFLRAWSSIHSTAAPRHWLTLEITDALDLFFPGGLAHGEIVLDVAPSAVAPRTPPAAPTPRR